MRNNSKEAIEHRTCPKRFAKALRLAGGENRFGEPNFRVVWGYDRIVPMTGEWQTFEKGVAKLTDKLTGYSESRPFIRLVESKIETRMVPKYLPGNCWHLEMWRPPEEYGRPEDWRKVGEEVIQGLTIDTAGEYPSRGEYELVFPLTSDWTSSGAPVPLFPEIVTEIVNMIRRGREETVNLLQRKAAIEQRERYKEEGFVKRTCDILKDGMRPFAGETFVTVPESKPAEPSKIVIP